MKLETKRLTIEAIRADTARRQSDAADPNVSAWVNANAGTGKTHVLTLRVLRLLLARTEPERILCLTYTKAAASEMSKRVFDRLAKWVTAPDAELAKDLAEINGVAPSDDDKSFARTLFAVTIETPGGLKVQTIHAFAERVLQRFPLEAGVAPDFKILDDNAVADFKSQSIERVLNEATADPSSALGRALDFVVRYAADAQFDKLIATAVDERRWLDATQASDAETAGRLESYLRQQLTVHATSTPEALTHACASVLSAAELRDLTEALAGGGKGDAEQAEKLRGVRTQDHAQCAAVLAGYFLTKDGEARGRLMTKAVAAARPDLARLVDDAGQKFLELYRERKALTLVEASVAMNRLSGAVLEYYTAAKGTAGALDFADLILKTLSLLRDRSTADWILFKLDGGLDHILVDEAQDTSPEQWAIVESLAKEFFAGLGRETGKPRTLFAVGDEKQSIYSFQGAAPEMFAATGTKFALLAKDAQMAWRAVGLSLSFRSVKPVLDAVDSVFADASRTPGLTAGGPVMRHEANRAGHSGLIEIWPVEKPDDTEASDPWDPLGDRSEGSPANRVAERIADTIKGWIDRKEMLRSEGRAIRAGDIVILVRKRNPFAVPMVAALKRRGIAVAGSDRIALVDQIAVQDLMTLGDFLSLPEDDLALASVLKSPLFGLTDEDLLTIAPSRKGTLWRALLDHSRIDLTYVTAAETLKRWRAKADYMPPFEFFSSVLDREGGRKKMLGRLGPEAADAIDEFLDLALAYDESGPPSMTLFLAELRAVSREVKRDMDHGRDEVRVMTVHGAKGLEAPIVFLPDTCTTKSGDIGTASLVKLTHLEPPDGSPKPLAWAVKGTSGLDAIQTARGANENRERDERNRLLYVAMTRARDRLYIAGFDGKKKRPDDCWYNCMFEALRPSLTEIDLGGGRTVWRNETSQDVDAKTSRSDERTLAEPVALPAFAVSRVTPEPKLSVPLAPSRLEPYAPNDEGEPVTPPPRNAGMTVDGPSPLAPGAGDRFLRGNLTHALLQHLPGIPQERRANVAAAFVKARGTGLSAQTQKSVVNETLAVLRAPGFAALFEDNSMAEVPIAAVIPRPRGKCPGLDLSGQIDRLAVTDAEVLIVDYKTNRPPPSDVGSVASAYLYQLAAYRLALGEIYPGKAVRCALLWTDGPRLMEIPREILDRFTAGLWDLDLESLDAS